MVVSFIGSKIGLFNSSAVNALSIPGTFKYESNDFIFNEIITFHYFQSLTLSAQNLNFSV